MNTITLLLTRLGCAGSTFLNLPATPAEIGEAFALLDEMGKDVTATEIVSVQSSVKFLPRYIQSVDVTQPENVQKLNSLAGNINKMDERKKQLFSGALLAESINGLDDVLRVSEHLNDYIFLPDITSDISLGRFLVCAGYKDFPEAVRPYLDYQVIGSEYYADHGGAYGPYGYVCRKGPMEHHIAEEHPALITIHMRTLEPDEAMGKQLLLALPATEEELEAAKTKMDIDYFADAIIERIDFGKPYLEELIPQDCFSVEDANELALSIEEMEQRDGEFIKYLSVLSAMQPETLPAALHLAAEIDGFERVTEDAEEYGKQVLERIGADQELIDTIDGFMDFEAFGEQMMEEDDVRQTPFGMVRRIGGFFPEPREEMTMGGM